MKIKSSKTGKTVQVPKSYEALVHHHISQGNHEEVSRLSSIFGKGGTIRKRAPKQRPHHLLGSSPVSNPSGMSSGPHDSGYSGSMGEISFGKGGIDYIYGYPRYDFGGTLGDIGKFDMNMLGNVVPGMGHIADHWGDNSSLDKSLTSVNNTLRPIERTAAGLALSSVGGPMAGAAYVAANQMGDSLTQPQMKYGGMYVPGYTMYAYGGYADGGEIIHAPELGGYFKRVR
jgi:hypothetical protein